MKSEIIKNIYQAIADAEQDGLYSEVEYLTGYSGKKLIGLLQRLSLLHSNEKTCYLEVGVYQGLTLLSVAKTADQKEAYGIDNFAQFDPQKKNYSIIKDRAKKLNISNYSLINSDYEDALEGLEHYIGPGKVGLYFVDGPHDYRSQLMCLELVKPYLAEDAIIVVDDSNYRHVRQANRDFLITNPDYKLVFESYTRCHPYNMSVDEKRGAREGWWNGVNVIFRDERNELEPMFPPTLRNRLLYENDHIVHVAKAPDTAPHLLRLISSILSFNLPRIGLNFSRLIVQLFKRPSEFVGKYRTMNTFSEGLPQSNYNKSFLD